MKKIGEVVVPSRIRKSPLFIIINAIRDLLQTTKYFWEVCNTDLDVSQFRWKKEIQYDDE